MSRDVPFEVESTVETAGRAYVLARLLEPGSAFQVPPGATLGGYALEEFLDIPIASGTPGQRGDLFAFRLRAAEDRGRFVEGNRVVLSNPADPLA